MTPPTGFAALLALPLSTLLPFVVFPSLFVSGYFVFMGFCAFLGMPHSKRLDKLAASKLLPRSVLEYGYWFLQAPVKSLVVVGITPNAITVSSLGFAVWAAVMFAEGRFGVGGWLLFASHTADALDGMVARATNVSSDRGEFFDAVIDRYADFAIYLGAMWFFRDQMLPLALGAGALIGSSVMGYAKAKGEAVGIDPNVGWMARHERGFVLGGGTVLSPLFNVLIEPGVAHPHNYSVTVALGLIALITNITAIWRAQFVMSRMKKGGT